MEKQYKARVTPYGAARVADFEIDSEEELQRYIKEFESNKGVYQRILIYEVRTGDAVYYYSAKK